MLAASAQAITVTLDANANEWLSGGEPVDETVSVLIDNMASPLGTGILSVYQTFDDDYLSIAIDRTITTDWYKKSYFVIAIDVDNQPDSGATLSPTTNVSFNGTYRPDYIFYTNSVLQTANWNNTQYNEKVWDGQAWVACSVNVGVSMVGQDSEFSIKFSDFCTDPGDTLRVWVYEVKRAGDSLLFYADGMNVTGTGLGDGIVIPIPEPASIALMSAGAGLIRRKCA